MEKGAGLGIARPEEHSEEQSKERTMEAIPESEREKTQPHLEKITSGVERIRKDEVETVEGMVGYIGSIKWQRVPVNEVSFCSKCGDLLGSQYGVVEYGNVDGPYYCMPDHLQEAKGTGV